MQRRHQHTLRAIYTVPAAMRWADIEALLGAIGHVKEREGSRIVAVVNGVSAVFHRPHPRPEARRMLIRDVRRLLVRAGVRPEGDE